MADKLMMEVFVEIKPEEKSQLDGPAGSVIMIPFSGTVKSDIFSGVLLPGGVDTQIVDVNGVKHMSARYMAEGTDNTGAACKIYIENNAFFNVDAPKPFKTIPTFYTDSKALAPYLHCNKFRGEGHPGNGGVVIKFFEVIND